jgi:LPXTG-motif cell wall-anchored protein
VSFSLYQGSVSTGNLVGTSTTDVNGNIVWSGLAPGTYVVVENSTIAGYTLPADTTTTVTVPVGEQVVLVLYNTPTATTPPPEIVVIPPPPVPAAPEASPTPTPSPSPTPTPIVTDEFVIEDVAPAYGPETGEGDILFILMGVLFLAGSALFVLRKKVIVNK